MTAKNKAEDVTDIEKQDMKDFITTLHGTKPKGYFNITQLSLKGQPSGKAIKFIPAQNTDEFIKTLLYMQQKNSHLDSYFGVCTFKTDKSREAENALSIPAMILDLDTRTGTHAASNIPNTPLEALAIMQKITGKKPSIVINTHGGIHAYYLLEKPFISENAQDYEQITAIMNDFEKAFQKVYSADPYKYKADSVCEPARILRIPHMINRKYGKKVEVIHKDGPRYTLAEIEAITAHMKSQAAPRNNDDKQNPPSEAPEEYKTDLDYLRSFIPNYLKNYMNIDYTKKRFCCINPDCTSSHPENPNMSYHAEKHYIKCFSCGARYNLFDLIGINEGFQTFTEQRKRAESLYIHFNENGEKPYHVPARQPKDQNPQATIEKAHSNIHMTDYFSRRGLSSAIIQKYKLGYLPNEKAVILPIGDNYYWKRMTEYKSHEALQGYNVPIFNGHYLQTATAQDVIFITESIIDALSLEEVRPDIKAIALSGTGYNTLKTAIKQHGTKADFIIAVDSDDSGNKMAEELKKELSALSLLSYRFNVEAGAGYKDINDYLLDDEELLAGHVSHIIDNYKAQTTEEETAKLEREKQAYQNTSAGVFVKESFITELERADKGAIPTGFQELDRLLDGGLYAGLYFIGAISSLGKTTIAMQIADQAAQAGHDVLIFSLEMSRHELIAKSLSRLTFIYDDSPDNRNAKYTRRILNVKDHLNFNPRELQLLQDALKEYGEYGARIFIREGIGDVKISDIKTALEEHKRYTGRVPLVIIDYLQIIAPHDMRASDKQNTDKAVTELKRMSRDFGASILSISSFNRDNYSQAVNMAAFKESGAIEYSSDVLIGLQAKGAGQKNFDVDAAKKKNPREIQLKILKNRNGETGDTINFEYYPRFNHFREVGIAKPDENKQTITQPKRSGKSSGKNNSADFKNKLKQLLNDIEEDDDDFLA
jgi:replicative DNA helicase